MITFARAAGFESRRPKRRLSTSGITSTPWQAIMLGEIQNPKSEARNPKQIRNSKFKFRTWDLFRISDFGFRIWLRGLLAAAVLGMVSLHAHPLLYPWLFDDDFALLTASWDWPSTRQNLWLPFDDNVWPLERLTSYVVVRSAGRITALPRATSLVGPIALAVAMLLVYLFVRREMSQPFYGLAAAILFVASLKD